MQRMFKAVLAACFFCAGAGVCVAPVAAQPKQQILTRATNPASLWAAPPWQPRAAFVQTMPGLAEIAAAAAAGAPALQSAGIWKVEFAYNFTLDRACTAAITLDCVREFIHEEVDSKGAWSPVATIPLPANPVGPSVTVSHPLQTIGYGARTGRLRASAVDSLGNAILSQPSQQFTYSREPNPPQSPKVVAQ